MHARIVAGLVALALLGGCRSAEIQTGEPRPTVQPAPPPLTADALPAGSMLEVELTQTLSTETSTVGEHFSARVKQALVARNNEVVVPMGATVHGTITGLDDSDHPGDQAAIRLDFDRLEIGSRSYAFEANVVDADVEFESEEDVEDVAEKAGIAAAAGAVLG
ncbi:hypothetical protein, partial [Actinokineospora sp.]|uniref:hypothetical protein n=1 Tax=Actinokineospora sp. TaxID=1872133 RepID=UPI0040383906